jgi:hypothetical protein
MVAGSGLPVKCLPRGLNKYLFGSNWYMASEKFVSMAEANRRLGKVGLPPTRVKMKERELEVLETAVRRMNPQSVRYLMIWFADATAIKQLGKPRFSGLGYAESTPREKSLFLIETFSLALGRILKNSFLKNNGYTIALTSSGEGPLEFALEIKKNKEPVGMYRFDMFFNRKQKPSVMLGYLQGGSKKVVHEFTRKAGAPLRDFFITCFRNAFRGNNKVVALNPAKHPYMRKLDKSALAHSMEARGKLAEGQGQIYVDHAAGIKVEVSGLKLQEIIRKVESEARRIQRDVPRKHAEAFERAGFAPTGGRTWRLKGPKKKALRK